jgi:hypothetical protein
VNPRGVLFSARPLAIILPLQHCPWVVVAEVDEDTQVAGCEYHLNIVTHLIGETRKNMNLPGGVRTHRKIAAYHEAGHALAALHEGRRARLEFLGALVRHTRKPGRRTQLVAVHHVTVADHGVHPPQRAEFCADIAFHQDQVRLFTHDD